MVHSRSLPICRERELNDASFIRGVACAVACAGLAAGVGMAIVCRLNRTIAMYKLLICTVLLLFGISNAQEPPPATGNPAKPSQAELVGTIAGRVLGAAKMCGIKSERLQSTAKHAFAAIDQIAHSESDRASADRRMRDGITLGVDDIREGRSTCGAIRSALKKLEQRLTQPPKPK